MTDVTGSALAAALRDRYRIERELGTGGMATVYLAEDLKHHRQVAVKVLRPELTAVLGPARFLKEIETTAKLQHPHILPLFDSGEADTFLYYVMPYVEGESLRGRLQREKQLSVPESLRIAREVLSALDYAHRHGIIHRDIKPENVLLHDGQALLADFGIALAVQAAGGSRMTETGLSLGTPGYMSPEQATGDRVLDARSDVYSVACLLYEMLAGEPPHTGPTVQSVIAAVVTKEPEAIGARRSTVPPHVGAAVHRALAKLPADRFESAAEFARALADSNSVATTVFMPSRPIRSGRRLGASLLLGILLAGVGASAGWLAHPRRAPVDPLRFYVTGDSGRVVTNDFTLLPDGSGLVYRARTPKGSQLFLQRFSELEPHMIPGTENATNMFLSPDGSVIGFLADQAVKRVRPDGSGLATIASFDGLYTGATWGEDGSVVFTKYDGRLYRVSSNGGTPEALEVSGLPQGAGLVQPRFLPGGKALVCVFATTASPGSVVLIRWPSGTSKMLGVGMTPQYVEPGYLAFGGTDGSLQLQAFDLSKLDTAGARRRIAEDVTVSYAVLSRFSVSRTGVLAYSFSARGNRTELALIDRQGQRRTLDRAYVWVPRLSPDGRRVAYGRVAEGQRADLWMFDRVLGTTQRLTSGGEVGPDYNDPIWSPDGKQLALSAVNGGAKDLYLAPADGSAPPALVLARPGEQWPSDWSRDQKQLVFTDVPANGKRAVMAVSLERHEVRPIVQTAYNATGGRISPDGHWLAYDSDETGRSEVYVQPFPGPGRKLRISADGGAYPAWARTGQGLFYWNQDALLSVELRLGAEVDVVRTETLFHAESEMGGVLAQYDVAPDGQSFVAAVSNGSNRIAIVSDVIGSLNREQ